MQALLEKERVPLHPYTDLSTLTATQLSFLMDLIISYAYLGQYLVSEELMQKLRIYYSMLIIANFFADEKVNKFLNSFFMEKIASFVEASISDYQEGKI